MKKTRFMLIHLSKNVYRFKSLKQAQDYAGKNCSGNFEWYEIIDTTTNVVVYTWSF